MNRNLAISGGGNNKERAQLQIANLDCREKFLVKIESGTYYHATQRDLQRPQMWIRLEQVDDSGEAEHVGHRKDALGDQRRIVVWPLTSRQLSR